MLSAKDEQALRKLLSLASEPEESLTYDALLGFLFGVAITPEVIMPNEWLPRVFGDQMINAGSEKELQGLFQTMARVLSSFIEKFNEDALLFPYDLESLTEEGSFDAVQDWAYGLDEALALRPDYWYEYLPDSVEEDQEEDYDEELLTALSVIHGIAFPDEAEELFAAEFAEAEYQPERLIASLLVMLPQAVDLLLDHAAALDREGLEGSANQPVQPPPAPKVGRNEPCPCGSGKKYNKCCLGKK